MARSLQNVFAPQMLKRKGWAGNYLPEIDDDLGAFDESLAASEGVRKREEKRALDNIFGDLQSRGLANSGIALKDVFEGVAGPAAERARSLAATFGLERANKRFDTAARFGLQDLMGAQEMEQLNRQAEIQRDLFERQRQVQAEQEREARRRKRRGGIAGLIAGGVGAALSGGNPLGFQIGSGLGSTLGDY